MTKEFCNYTQSLALKELGFDEPCIASYFFPQLQSLKYTPTWQKNSTLHMSKDGCTAPLYQQAFRWFRERYGWVAEINSLLMSGNYFARLVKPSESRGYDIKMCGTYEDAELECLIKLIEIVKKESNG